MPKVSTTADLDSRSIGAGIWVNYDKKIILDQVVPLSLLNLTYLINRLTTCS